MSQARARGNSAAKATAAANVVVEWPEGKAAKLDLKAKRCSVCSGLGPGRANAAWGRARPSTCLNRETPSPTGAMARNRKPTRAARLAAKRRVMASPAWVKSSA